MDKKKLEELLEQLYPAAHSVPGREGWLTTNPINFYGGLNPQEDELLAKMYEESQKPNFPMFPDRKGATYEPFDIQKYGQAEADEIRTLHAKSQTERDIIKNKEWEKTSGLARVAGAFGLNVSAGQRPAGGGGTKDPAAGVAEAAATRAFMEELYRNPPRTKSEAWELVRNRNATAKQIALLTSLFPKLDLGKVTEMHRWNKETNSIETIHRHVDAPNRLEKEAGFSFDKDWAKMGKTDFEAGVTTETEAKSARLAAEITEAAINARIKTGADLDAFKATLSPELAAALKIDPDVMSALKDAVPDNVWKYEKTETLFAVGADGKTIVSKDFDTGGKDYLAALNGTYAHDPMRFGSVKGGTLKWARKAADLDINARVHATEFFESLVTDPANANLTPTELKFKFVTGLPLQGIRISPDIAADIFDKGYDAQNRKAEQVSMYKSLLFNILDKPPESVNAVIEAVNKLQDEATDKAAFVDAEDWLWEQFETRYPYPDDEPRTLWHPVSGKFIENIGTYAKRNDAFKKGYISEEPIPTSAAVDKRAAKQHHLITDTVTQLPAGALTWQYEGQELTPAQNAKFLERHPQGMTRFSRKGEDDFVKGYSDEVKAEIARFDELTDNLKTIIQASRQGGGADIALINKVVKMYDEEGVVRASDTDMIQKLEPVINTLRLFIEKQFTGKPKLLSEEIVKNLEAVAYATWRIKWNSLADRVDGMNQLFDSNVLPSAYDLGEDEYDPSAREQTKWAGEGVKRTWTSAVGNRILKIQQQNQELNPYVDIEKVPQLPETYVLKESFTEELRRIIKLLGGDVTTTPTGGAKTFSSADWLD